MRRWSCLKRALGPEPDYPGSLANLGSARTRVAWPLAVVVGLSHSFGAWPEIGSVLVALGFHAVLTFVAIAVADAAYEPPTGDEPSSYPNGGAGCSPISRLALGIRYGRNARR